MYFRAALRHRLIPSNPFADINGKVRGNPARYRFITREMTSHILDACPDLDWRLLVVLARYGGLRTPSESLSLTWQDIEWEKNRVTVHSPKTEHHEGKATRVIPLFPELRPYLEEARYRAEPGTTHVIKRYHFDAKETRTGWKQCNLRTTFGKIIRRAGLLPWPKLWQNLRSTRQTELAESFPSHVVAKWIGNSERIAEEHYLQLTDEHFERAITMPAITTTDMASNVAQKAAQYAHATTVARHCTAVQDPKLVHEKTQELPGVANSCTTFCNCHLGAEGFEPAPNSSGKPQVSVPSAAKSGAVGARDGGFDPEADRIGDHLDADLATVVGVWPSLSQSARDAILRIVAQDGQTP
jgi:hypothetical protein